MRTRARFIVAAGASALLLCATDLSAQDRFAVVAQHTLAGVSGLRVVTIRDSQLSSCYTLFIMEPVVAQEGIPVPLPAADDSTDESVRRIRDAAARRSQQLAELQTRASRSASTDPNAASGYELDRRRIEREYEEVLQAEIPGSHPWASAVPGTYSGGVDDPASAAVRRALADPELTSTMKAVVERLDHLDSLLRRLLEAPRMAVTPERCAADSVGPVMPIR